MGLFLVKPCITSENRQKGIEEEDEYTIKIYYKFDRKTRDKIRKIRQNTRYIVLDRLVKFEEGIYIGTDEHIKRIMPAIRKADEELKKIHPSLGASLKLFPLDENKIKKGQIYQEFVFALYQKIMEELPMRC